MLASSVINAIDKSKHEILEKSGEVLLLIARHGLLPAAGHANGLQLYLRAAVTMHKLMQGYLDELQHQSEATDGGALLKDSCLINLLTSSCLQL